MATEIVAAGQATIETTWIEFVAALALCEKSPTVANKENLRLAKDAIAAIGGEDAIEKVLVDKGLITLKPDCPACPNCWFATAKCDALVTALDAARM